MKGENLSFDTASSLRDFLHVADVGSAIVSLLESSVCGPVNIGSGSAISVREVIQIIGEIYNTGDQIEFAEHQFQGRSPDAVVADTTILNLDCHWYASVSFMQRMLQTCAWWKAQYK